jgi:transcriptional regulator with XRE-family HTH domain
MGSKDATPNALGEKLTAFRNRRKIAIKAAAIDAKLTPETIRRWESGETVPDLAKIVRYCKSLNVPPAEMIELCNCAYKDEIATLKNATEAANAASAFPRFGTQEEFYSDLVTLCKERDGQGRNITFYHYSGAAIETMVQTLYKNGFCITIYTQDPNFTRLVECSSQTWRIESFRRTYADNYHNAGLLRIYESAVPLTLRAVNFDDELIILGWYIYELGKTLRLWGHSHESAGLYEIRLKRSDSGFEQAMQFLKRYEKMIAPQPIVDGVPTPSEPELKAVTDCVEKYKKLITERLECIEWCKKTKEEGKKQGHHGMGTTRAKRGDTAPRA